MGALCTTNRTGWWTAKYPSEASGARIKMPTRFARVLFFVPSRQFVTSHNVANDEVHRTKMAGTTKALRINLFMTQRDRGVHRNGLSRRNE